MKRSYSPKILSFASLSQVDFERIHEVTRSAIGRRDPPKRLCFPTTRRSISGAKSHWSQIGAGFTTFGQCYGPEAPSVGTRIDRRDALGSITTSFQRSAF